MQKLLFCPQCRTVLHEIVHEDRVILKCGECGFRTITSLRTNTSDTMITCIPNTFLVDCLTSFDQDDQLDILQEECSELIKACSKLKRQKKQGKPVDLDSLKEELAHVLISSSVVAQIHGVSVDDIMREVATKALKYHFSLYEIPL